MYRLTAFLLLFFSFAAQAQKSTDPGLNNRLQEYIALNKQLDFEKVMNYTHPKLFDVAPREAIIQAMDQAFHNEKMKISIDSISILSVGPLYKYGKESYRKISYYMGMTMVLSDSMDLKNKPFADYLTKSLQISFPGKKITIDTDANAFKIMGSQVLFAIKDDTVASWMFLGYDPAKPELSRRLYPKAVRQYFKLL
jgi:hypothetical protein